MKVYLGVSITLERWHLELKMRTRGEDENEFRAIK